MDFGPHVRSFCAFLNARFYGLVCVFLSVSARAFGCLACHASLFGLCWLADFWMVVFQIEVVSEADGSLFVPTAVI